MLGYLFSDDFLISLGCKDEFDDSCGFTASYNLQLEDTDYIGFSYNTGDSADLHQISSRYFFAVGEESYLVLGGGYTLDKSDNRFADDYWSINGSYYYDARTSISAYYTEGDYYGVSGSYFVNENYSIQAGYHSVSSNKKQDESDGYFFSYSAQF